MATIEVLNDGPLKVTGVKQFLNSRGVAIAIEDTAFLCRCGASANKPFCDGSHKKTEFKSECGKPASPAATSQQAGESRIDIRKNGPLGVTGVPDLVCAKAPADPARYSLCRCGLSQNKPFCDGAHKNSAFSDDKN
jgi:CDGSH-type Zn-finger protein